MGRVRIDSWWRIAAIVGLAGGVAVARPGNPGAGGILGSLSGTGQHPVAGTVADEEVFSFQSGAGPLARHFTTQGWSVGLGDLNGDGSFDAPTDVDGLWVRAGTSAPVDMPDTYFSLLQDQGPYQDGDILQAMGGSVVVRFPESFFVNLIGSVDGNVDVADFGFTATGDLLWTFAQDEGSTVLPVGGGTIQDGDVLRYDVTTGAVSIAWTEAQIQQMVDQATGSPQTAIGAVLGLDVDPATQALWFSVRSPSAIDATIFSSAGGGSMVAGYTESDLGFSNAVELDAIAAAPALAPPPLLEVDTTAPPAGGSLGLAVQGATPGQPVILLASLAVTANPGGLFGVAGTWYPDPSDSLFQQLLGTGSAIILICDGNGDAGLSLSFGSGSGQGLIVTAQVVDWFGGILSTPTAFELP